MAPIKVRPTRLDKEVARGIARRTDLPLEQAATVLAWGADEHFLIAAAALGWLVTRSSKEPVRRFSTHVLACSLASAVLPHLLKTIFDQQRPDRRTIAGHWRGVPLSGKPEDAFPSGHAVHVGALAAAATLLPPKIRFGVWATGGFLAATRIVLLAHWVTDVLAGLGLGVVLERALRVMTRPVPIGSAGRRMHDPACSDRK
jgi:membrane-associated phospholipid phosphatase